MIRFVQRYLIVLLACLLALTFSVWPQLMQKAAANMPSVLEQEASLVTYNPPNLGAPGETSDGGSRGCGDLLIALQPSRYNWGETADTHPTLWIHTSSAAQPLELSISEEDTQEPLYQTTFRPVDHSGFSRYVLPYDATSLALDTPYRWQVTQVCPSANDDYLEVEGVIVRRAISEELQAALNQAAPRGRVILLASNGLWYDALEALAELRLANETDETLAADWRSLLQDVQLDDSPKIEEMPLVSLYPQAL